MKDDSMLLKKKCLTDGVNDRLDIFRSDRHLEDQTMKSSMDPNFEHLIKAKDPKLLDEFQKIGFPNCKLNCDLEEIRSMLTHNSKEKVKIEPNLEN